MKVKEFWEEYGHDIKVAVISGTIAVGFGLIGRVIGTRIEINMKSAAGLVEQVADAVEDVAAETTDIIA